MVSRLVLAVIFAAELLALSNTSAVVFPDVPNENSLGASAWDTGAGTESLELSMALRAQEHSIGTHQNVAGVVVQRASIKNGYVERDFHFVRFKRMQVHSTRLFR